MVAYRQCHDNDTDDRQFVDESLTGERQASLKDLGKFLDHTRRDLNNPRGHLDGIVIAPLLRH